MFDVKLSRVCGTALPLSLMSSFAFAQVAVVPDTIPAEDRAALAVDPNWQVPRTSWGHPNLEGNYSTDDMRSVPRERPEEYGTRDKLTPEEFAERAKADAALRDRILNQSSYSSNSVGSRTFGWTSQIIDPPNGRMPAMTAEGQARANPRDRGSYGPGPFNTFEDFHNYDRCLTRGVLGSAFATIYGNGMKIAQSPDSVVISYEMLADSRVIYLDDRPFAQDNLRQWLGSSRGHWEGDTLVVETQGFTGKTSLGNNGTKHSLDYRLTERIRRVDPEMIEYVATANDPKTYESPVTFRMMWTTQPGGYEIYEYSCHEGNRAISGGLGGERNYEARVREAVARGETPPERLPSQPNLDPLPEDESVFININEGEHQ